MKYTTLLLFLVLTSFCPKEPKVYICGSKGAKKYHYKENCRGLSACTHGVMESSLSQAQGFGLTLCGWED